MKVGIVGAGFVGSTAAYTMALEGAASEIVLVDINEELARAQAEDILHATPHGHPVRVYAAGYDGLQKSAAVILACGVNQEEDESRLELLERNAEVFKEVVPQVIRAEPQALLVIASNPVDIITHITTRIADYAPERVIGSGTILDTARFRSLIGQHLGVSSRSVHSYVLGEHGDSEVLAWSSAHIGGVPLLEFANQVKRPISEEVRKNIDNGVRKAAGRIIDGKGATYYGIGAGLSRIIRAIRDDEGAVLSLTSRCTRGDNVPSVSFSVPRVLGSNGITAELWPALSDSEYEALDRSVQVISEATTELGY